MEKRGVVDHTETLDTRRVMLTCELPLNEILIDFNDKIKSITRGYGSMDYEHAGYPRRDTGEARHAGQRRAGGCVLLHRASRQGGGPGTALAANSRKSSRASCTRSPSRRRSAARSSRAKVSRAMRKDVTAKCYGGDITRKRKLLEKQKEGKKRMKSIGKVNIPQEAFIEVLKSSAVNRCPLGCRLLRRVSLSLSKSTHAHRVTGRVATGVWRKSLGTLRAGSAAGQTSPRRERRLKAHARSSSRRSATRKPHSTSPGTEVPGYFRRAPPGRHLQSTLNRYLRRAKRLLGHNDALQISFLS